MVLVQGDTASAFAVALGAFLVGARVGHVEAGLRSGGLKAPFPEELMRLMVDRATDTYFAPTTFARDNLLREGVDEGRVFVTGNTVTDALRFICELRTTKIRAPEWRTSGPHVLITMHRRESFGAPMLESLRAIQQLVEHYPDLSVIFPVHPNPNVRSAVRDALASHPRICLCEPLDYLALVRLLSEAQLVLSDSGGIQEEAPSFNVPVLILRDVTERPEGITFARNRLVGTSRSRILRAAAEVLAESAPAPGRALAPSPSVFGDGVTASRIARIVEATLYDHSIDRGEVEYHFTAPRHTGRRRAV
jgi:UDP-N-acetylglucosamine 2-epimerase (non-hydrolysing)